MPRRRTATAIAVLAAAALAAPAGAQADVLHDHHSSKERLPRIIVKDAAKPLSLKQASARQAKSRKTGEFPPAPRLASNKGLAKAAQQKRSTRDIAIGPEATTIPTTRKRPNTIDPKLFGFQGTYEAKRWAIVNWVNYTYSSVLGSAFRQPRVYELAGTGTTPDGCGPVANAMFCWGNLNTAAFNAQWNRDIFNRFGDAAFAEAVEDVAVVMAHEYGHGATSWLGFAGRGKFVYQIYREGFADCMAGAWLYWMQYNRYTDNIGRGDRQEMHDLMFNLGSSNRTTTFDNHGDAAWRTSLSAYGFNNGFRGCIAWGRTLAG